MSLSDFFGNNYMLDELTESYQEQKKIPTPISKEKEQFLAESRFKIFEEALNKAKVGTKEYDTILENCIDEYLKMKGNMKLDAKHRESIVKLIKDKSLDQEMNDAISKDVKNKWPKTGRITLKDAISKDLIGQNKEAKYPKRVTYAFGGDKKVDSQPSPSSKEQIKSKKVETII